MSSPFSSGWGVGLLLSAQFWRPNDWAESNGMKNMEPNTAAARAATRAARRQQRTEIPLSKMPFRQLRNPFPPMEIISPDQLQQLHNASMQILENIGLDFLDPEALSLWAKAGARVDHAKQHVWIDRGLLMQTIANAPASFTLRARNPE